ncbi:MAG: tetratricopeptide repeat protein [Akkermansiaceae bacterium]|nr:tetratricopeptide repeat protein [Akkermansiaceae bacterium]
MSRSFHALHLATFWAGCLAILPATSFAQAPPPPERPPAAFDPADVYFQAWLLCNDAEKLEKQGKPAEALAKLRRANQMFDTIAANFPEWKKDMLETRRRKTADHIADVLPKAMEQEEKRDQAVAELEGRRTGDGPAPGPEVPVAPTPGNPADTLATRRVRELEKQVADLQDEIARQREAATDPAKKDQAERQRDRAIADLQKARTELDRLRRDATEGPMQEEVDALARRINKLEAEKEVMGRALEQSRQETEQAKSQIDALQGERARLLGQIETLKQDLADNKRNLELERGTSNEIIEGQQRQIRQLQGTIQKKDEQLAESRKTIERLESELGQIRESFEGLREERDELLRERDQMAALLKLNEAGQLQEVIDQNLALDRELRETKKRFEALQTDSDATAEDLKLALRDLSIAKLRIQEFRQTNQDQEKRLADLQQRLQQEASSVQENAVDPGEAQMLRAILDRQIKIQEKRAEARNLLFEQLRQKAQGDPDLQRAMDNFQGNELNLTPEELAIIEGQVVDGTIISPYARPRSEVERAYADLNEELRPYDAAATRAYLEGRPLAAREAWEMMIERNPGDVASMCKLGLVENELGNEAAAADMFRRATELDPNNPYAHRMLGYFLDRFGEREEAIAALRRSAELSPTDPRTHQLLGNCLFRAGRLDEAREAYSAALDCDPASPETHHNLAILLARSGKKEKALEHYNKALELGTPPNSDLEKIIGFTPADPTPPPTDP